MTNSIALTLEKERFGNGRKKQKNNSFGNDVKKIANDSLFFFAIFLTAFFALQYIPVVFGLVGEINIGINEIAVSVLGFANVFFVLLFSKKLKSS